MQQSSRTFLQRQVAIASALAAFVLAAISFVRRWQFFPDSVFDAFVHPAVSAVLVGGGFLALTALELKGLGRVVQVIVLIVFACFAAIQAKSGDLTSSVFFGLGLLLAVEYDLLDRFRVLKISLSMALFISCLAYGVYTASSGSVLSTIHTLLGTALFSFLFIAVVRLRLRESRAREDLLESTVRQRTIALQQEIDRRVVLEGDLRDTATKSQQLASDRALLLHELHHRTKNDLQLVSSLLRLHGEKDANPSTDVAIRAAEDRILAIALVHEYLYSSEALAEIDLQDYLDGLLSHLQSSRDGMPVEILRDLNGATVVGLEPAVHIGLVVNELVLNSLKHAFPDKEAGTISVKIVEEGENLLLQVDDNGVGVGEDVDLHNTGQIGIQIVKGLVDQLEGTIELVRRPNTSWRIVIPRAGISEVGPAQSVRDERELS